MLWVLITLRQVAVSNQNMDYDGFFAKAIPTMEAAKGTVQFASMLSVLFLGLGCALFRSRAARASR